MRNKLKAILVAVFAAAALAGCSAGPPGTYLKANLPGDYGLSCEAIQAEIYANEATRRQLEAKFQDATDWARGVNRDYQARKNVLQGLLYEKGCVSPQSAGAAAGGQQPAPKEKSRVVICNEGQTCVVE